jgi:hypothetical protein|tara:strand:- start:694 stop:879 length:186 start_codon:yes stop_codon:yes gene_type:complete
VKDFSWSEHQDKIVSKRVKKHGSIVIAILEMDAQIAALKVEVDALRDLVDWDTVEKEIEEE